MTSPGADETGPSNLPTTDEGASAATAADHRLRRSEALRRLAGKLARVGGWSLEADGTVYWSDEVFRILEVPEGGEPAFEDALAQYPPEHRERLQGVLRRAVVEGEPFDLELDVDTYRGRRLPVRVLGEAERGADGRVVRVIGAIQDVSDLRAATAETEAAVRRLTTTLESMTDALFTVDRTWTFTYLNERAGQLLRRDRLELIGRTLWQEFPEAVGSPLHRAYHRAMESGETEVVEVYYFEPLDTWFSVNAYPSDQGLAVYFRDVTEERAARVALEQQARLLDEAQDAIVVRDLDDRITSWNRSAERVYGWRADEAVGADARSLLAEDVAVFDAAKAQLLASGTWAGEVEHRTRAGGRLTVDTRWNLLDDDDGAPRAVFTIDTDITDRRRIEQQLLRAQRMESIGTLASGVAHDLNNVLSPIVLAADLLQMQDPVPEQISLLETIATSARRGADLVGQVLSFARGVDGDRRPIDLEALLRDLEAIVRDTFPKNLRFELVLPERIGTTLGDSTQIQQVLLNLAVNARDAMPDGGRLAISVSEVHLDEQYVAAAPEVTAGDHLLVEVEDSGVGMAPEVLERAFEPFYTTKAQGAGTGLGLSTAAAIVRSHGGFLTAYSEPGRGSRFHLYLPRAAGLRPTTGSTARQQDLPRGRGETVLVVDDEPAVRSMTRQTLEAYGYHVLEAGDGAEAVSVFAQHQQVIDVVLTDMMMPVMDGPATIHALRSLDPRLRIIGASGLQAKGQAAPAANAGVEHFLPKPYSSRSLLELLAHLTGGGDG